MSVGYPHGVVKELLADLPELRDSYETRRDGLEIDGTSNPYLVFSVTLNPYLWKLLAEPGDEAALRRVFAFLERLATDPDHRVRTLVAIDTLETLAGEDIGARAVGFMGPATRTLFVEREEFVAAAQITPIQRIRSVVVSIVQGRRGKVRRLLRELTELPLVDPDSVGESLRGTAIEIAHLQTSLVAAAESYLRDGARRAVTPRLITRPEVFHGFDWKEESTVVAATTLYHRWRKLVALAKTLSA